MSDNRQTETQDNTDIAALAAAIVAVAVSLFVAPEEFGILNLVVSLVLLLVFFAFVWPKLRSFVQSLAVAASIGFASIPAIGFLDEVARFREPIAFLKNGSDAWNCELDRCRKNKENHQSQVPAMDLAGGWLGITCLVLIVDLASQRRRRRRISGN